MTESKTPRTNEHAEWLRYRAASPYFAVARLGLLDAANAIERLESAIAAALAAKERAEAMTHEHRSEFLGEIQRRVIELGGDPPYWPARNDIEAHDDVESAARMILELLQERDALAAKLAEDDGMVRVPREPSETMIDAAFDATVWPDLSRATSSDVIASLRENMRKEYRAMLAAAEKETK